MEPHDIDRLRRSVVMLPPGHSAGALTREQALSLIEEVERLDTVTARYREVIAQLRVLLNQIDGG
jgi:hypothetical protein